MFSDKQLEIITASLMGDGSLDMESNKLPSLTLEMISDEYLKYIHSFFPKLSTPPREYRNVWRLRIRSHPQLKYFKLWYGEKGKEWPERIKLSSTVLKHLYAQDGSTQFGTSKNANAVARICTSNEQENRDKVSRMFKKAGLPEPTWDVHQFRWSVEDSKKIFDYMGEPLPDFEYKWPEEYRQS